MKAVLFDLDGTLLNTLGDLADAANWALVQLGFPTHPEDAYRFFVGNGVRELCRRMLPSPHQTPETAAKALALFDTRYQSHMFDRTAPYPGIPELLEDLAAHAIPMGIISNKPDPFVRSIAERFFPGRFQSVSGPLENRLKPDPSGVLRVLKELSVPPEQALYAGDSGVDMETACRGGLHGCGVLWGFRGEQELRANGAEFLAAAPADLGRIALAQEG